MTFDELEYGIIEDVKAELLEDGEALDETAVKLLTSKVKGAIRKVKAAYKFRSSDSPEFVLSKMEQAYENIKAIAMYDYNHIGAEGETAHAENGISRHYVNENELYAGIIPITRFSR